MMGRQLFVALDVTDAVDCGWGGDWPRDRDLHITVLYDHHGYGVDDLKEAVVVLSEYLTGVEFSFQLQSEGAWSSSRRAIVCKGDYLLSTLRYVQERYPWYYPHLGWQPHVTLGAGRCSPGPVKVCICAPAVAEPTLSRELRWIDTNDSAVVCAACHFLRWFASDSAASSSSSASGRG